MINYVEHFFMCLLAIHLLLWNAYSFAQFLVQLFVLVLNCKSSLYILDTSALPDIWFANTFSQSVVIFSYFFFQNKFIYLFLPALGLRCHARAFFSCGEQGATLRCGARASHCSGFSCCGARALGVWASVVAARGLSTCGSQAIECRLSSRGAWG